MEMGWGGSGWVRFCLENICECIYGMGGVLNVAQLVTGEIYAEARRTYLRRVRHCGKSSSGIRNASAVVL